MIVHNMRGEVRTANRLYHCHSSEIDPSVNVAEEHAKCVRHGLFTLARTILTGWRLKAYEKSGKKHDIEWFDYQMRHGEIVCFHRIFRKGYVK